MAMGRDFNEKEIERGRAFENMLNTSPGMAKGLCEYMATYGHRTIQQLFTNLAFEWIRLCATEDYGKWTDGRNEATHDKCKKIVAAVDEYDLYVPYI